MADEIGRVLGGRYRLLAPLGAGASAQVYLADDVRLRRRVAVKILHAGLAEDESFLRRFRAEAQAAAALSHPHIVAVYDWNGDEGTSFLVTEYLSGGSLRSVLDAGHRLTPSQALIVGLEAARALDHAHRQGFVHRDVKPANVLFGEDARLRVADFGLARAVAEAGWTEPTGAVLGTARYASPEQARGESIDGRSDVYALALLLIEAVTGRVPFSADTTIGTLMARLERSVDVPDELGPLAPIVADAGKIDAGDRIDAATFGARLVAAAEHLTRPAPLPLVRSVTAPGFGNGPGPAAPDSTLLPPVPPPGAGAPRGGGRAGVGPRRSNRPRSRQRRDLRCRGGHRGRRPRLHQHHAPAHRARHRRLEPARGLHTRMAERPRRRRAPLIRPTVARRSQRPPSLARRRGGRGRDHAGRGGLLGLHDLAGAVARGARRVDRGPGGRGQRAGGWLRLEDRRREELLRGHRRGRGRRHHARARHRAARGRAHHVDGFAGTAAGVGAARPGGVDPRGGRGGAGGAGHRAGRRVLRPAQRRGRRGHRHRPGRRRTRPGPQGFDRAGPDLLGRRLRGDPRPRGRRPGGRGRVRPPGQP